jgi:hypothetical protein
MVCMQTTVTLPRTIRPSPAAAAVFAVAWLGLVAFMEWLVVFYGNDPDNGWVVGGLAAVALPVLMWYRRSVTLAPEGLTYRAFTFTYRVPWHDLAAWGVWRFKRTSSLALTTHDGARLDVSLQYLEPADTQTLLACVTHFAPQARQTEVAKPSELGIGIVGIGGSLASLGAVLAIAAAMERTLGAGGLALGCAALGFAAGAVLGRLAGARTSAFSAPWILSFAAVTLALALPAGVLMANLRPAGPGADQRVLLLKLTVEAPRKKSQTERYFATYRLSGFVKQTELTPLVFHAMREGDDVPICTYPGALGYTVVGKLGYRCGARPGNSR